MNAALLKLMGLHDARGTQGVYARGTNVYNGISNAPNPVGINQSSAARKLLELRMKMQGGQF